MKQVLRNMVRLGRSHPRVSLLVAAALAMIVVTGMLGSCGQRPTPPTRPIVTPPPPRDGRVIRVRLLEAVTSARLHTEGPFRLIADGQVVADERNALPPTDLQWTGEHWTLGPYRIEATVLELVPQREPAGLNGRGYHGRMVFRSAGPAVLSADNHVALEDYLPGVLARELYPNWHTEAYKALAVAARTYAIYEMDHAGRRRAYDVFADQRSQVYGGIVDETPKSLHAVGATAGQVLVWGPTDRPRVLKAYYSSCCGGITNPAEWLEPQPEPAPPLAGGVLCSDCQSSNRYRWADVVIPKADVVAALVQAYKSVALMGEVRAIRVVAVSEWNRPVRLQIDGPDGLDMQLRADDLRLALLRSGLPEAKKLYSMNCAILDEGANLRFTGGRGFGHSVGLCQWGAQGKASRGLAYHEILYSYYPSARIMKAYP